MVNKKLAAKKYITPRIMEGTSSDRLKAALTKLGMTAAELGRRAGVKDGTVRAAANGYAAVSKKNAAKFARHLGVDPSWLLFGTGKGLDGKTAAPPVSTNRYNLPDSLPATERQHVADLIDALARRDPEVVAFIRADIEAVAEQRILNVKMAASERAGVASTIAKRAENEARSAESVQRSSPDKALKAKAKR